MEPRERLAIIESLAALTGSRLKSFFRAHDLGAAYAKNSGSSKRRRLTTLSPRLSAAGCQI